MSQTTPIVDDTIHSKETTNVSSQTTDETKEQGLKNNDYEEKEIKSQWKDVSAEWKKINDTQQLLNKLKDHKCDYHINPNGSVTFYPSPFLSEKELGSKSLNKIPFLKSKQYQQIMKETNCDPNKLEALFDPNCEIIETPNDLNGAIIAIEIAYFLHYPLKISPSHIWLLITQSIGMHIDQNAEKLRNAFVSHQGKKDLIVRRQDFVKGSKHNKWDEVIKEFAQQIDKNAVQDTVKLLECNFSNSTDVEQIAGKVAIMDIMKSYFNYVMYCGCGFPQITLDGTKQDWIDLKNKLMQLLAHKVDVKFGKIWGEAILPLMDRFIDAFDGKIDCLFWNSMLRRGAIAPSYGYYGVTDINKRGTIFYCGWFNILFPLIKPKNNHWNSQEKKACFAMNGKCIPYSDKDEYVKAGLSQGKYGGPHADAFPRGVASAPVKYIDLMNGKEYKMKFIAGFIGCDQNEKTLEITPKIGWIIGEE